MGKNRLRLGLPSVLIHIWKSPVRVFRKVTGRISILSRAKNPLHVSPERIEVRLPIAIAYIAIGSDEIQTTLLRTVASVQRAPRVTHESRCWRWILRPCAPLGNNEQIHEVLIFPGYMCSERSQGIAGTTSLRSRKEQRAVPGTPEQLEKRQRLTVY